MQNKQLPYYEIPPSAENYSAGSVASRQIDGLGFRFYWATEGLRTEDLNYRSSTDARSSMETIQHIYEMSGMIKNAVTETVNTPGQSPQLAFDDMRRRTLENLKVASDILKDSNEEDLQRFSLIFERGEERTAYPFWNLINGPLSDCLWHTGQIVSLRRMSGNPFTDKVSLMRGTVKD